MKANAKINPYQTIGPESHWQGYEYLRPNLENNAIYKIRVFFEVEEKVATITNHALMQNDMAKLSTSMTDDEILDFLKAASAIGEKLEQLGYEVRY